MHVAGLKRSDMAAHVQKTDGSKPALHAIDDVVAKKTADPKWEGETKIDDAAKYMPKDVLLE